MVNYTSTTKGGHFYKSSYGGGYFNHGSTSSGTNTPIPHSNHGSPLPSFLPNSSTQSHHHHHQIYSNIKGLPIPSPPISRSAAPSPSDSFSNNHRITHLQPSQGRKKGQFQQQQQLLRRTAYTKSKKLPSTGNNSPCGVYDDEFYKSQQMSKQQQQQQQQGAQMIMYGNAKEDSKMVISPQDMASYSFKKKIYHHKKSASTLSPQISTMLGKYSNIPSSQVLPESGAPNDKKSTKFINHINQQKNFSNLNIGISDAINKQKSTHSNNVSNSSTPNHMVLDSQNPNFLHHPHHLQQSNANAHNNNDHPTGSYIVQIHQHSHQHQYHYHLSDQQQQQAQPTPPTASFSSSSNNATPSGSRPTTGGGSTRPINYSDFPHHQPQQLHQQQQQQQFRKSHQFANGLVHNNQNSIAQSQVLDNTSSALSSSHNNSASKKPLHMRTKSDHMFQNLPGKTNNSATLKNNFMRTVANKQSNSNTNNHSLTTASSGNHNNSKFISSAFKKQHQKSSSQVPHLPIRKVLTNNNMLNQSQSGYNTPKIPSARGGVQYSNNKIIQNHQNQYQTANTPGSNSSRIGTAAAIQRKSSMTNSAGKKSPGFGNYSLSTTTGVGCNTATPNFKNSIASSTSSVSSNSAKKNMLANSNSPVPHPSYSQHVTPKSSNTNTNISSTNSNNTNNNIIRKVSAGAVNNNARYINKVSNNNCMIGIGKGLPPGQQVPLQLRQGPQFSQQGQQNGIYKKTPTVFHKRSTSEGTPSGQNQMIRNYIAPCHSNNHNSTAIPAAPISGSDMGMKRQNFYMLKNQERIKKERLSCVDQEMQQQQQNASSSSLVMVDSNEQCRKKITKLQAAQQLSHLRQNAQSTDPMLEPHYQNQSNLKNKSFRFKKDDANSSASSLQNNSMQSVSQSMNQQLLPGSQLSPRSNTFQKYSFYIGAPGNQKYVRKHSSNSNGKHSNQNNKLLSGGVLLNHMIASDMGKYRKLQQKRQGGVEKSNNRHKKIMEHQIRSTPVSNLNSLEVITSNESQKEKIVYEEDDDQENMMVILDQNSHKNLNKLSKSPQKNQAIKGTITKIPSVRQAYGLPKRQAIQNAQNQKLLKSQSPETQPIKSTRSNQKPYEVQKNNNSNMVCPPPPSNLKQFPGQFVRRKSSSISSQKEISNHHPSNFHHFRKGSHPITSKIQQHSNNNTKKRSPNQAVKLYSHQVKETKHKPSNSLAISNNIVKTPVIMTGSKKVNQPTPKSARGTLKQPIQHQQPSPFTSKMGKKANIEECKKASPNPTLISKPHKALINHQNKFQESKAARVGSRYQLVDLTPPSSGLNLGQAGETIENLLPRQETTTSACQLTPRSKNKHKLTRYIKAYFDRFNQAPQTTADFYRVGKMLGRGAFGKVNLALHKLTNELVAVKSMNKTMLEKERSKRKVLQEITILKRIRHPHIVNLFETFETKKHILFVMELCAGGDLLNYVRKRRRLKEPLAKFVFMQIVSGLHYCHLNRILHRDIKLDNILLDAYGHVKICDFGVSKIVRTGERIKDQCGTPAYIAPEILLDDGYEGYTVDIWSVGVVLYAMLYGTVPFKANCMKDLHKLIIDAQYTLKEDISEDARDLLRKILQPNPSKRYTMEQILHHNWMQDIDNTLTLFTETQKRIIRSEFTYNDCRRYNRNENSDIFTEHQLDTEANQLQRNITEKSIILAPFNSTKSHISTDFHDSVEELVRTRAAIRFGAKVRQIDRQYQQNNNNQLDNGVYNKYICQEREQELLSPDLQPGTPKSPRSPRKQSYFEEEENILSGLNQNNSQKKKSELEKLQKTAIDGIVKFDKLRQFDEEDKSAVGGIYNLVMQQELEEDIIEEVVLCGYPRDYVVKSLKAKQANYATTTYYLLQSIKAGFAFNVFREIDGLGFSIEKANEKLKETLNAFKN